MAWELEIEADSGAESEAEVLTQTVMAITSKMDPWVYTCDP